jgi:uracil DNA glycosylase
MNHKCLFILLGNNAKNIISHIKNGIYVTASHPSPYSASNGFFGSGIFKKVEELLNK